MDRERSYDELFTSEEDEVEESYRIQQQEQAFELGADYGRVMGWYDEPPMGDDLDP